MEGLETCLEKIIAHFGIKDSAGSQNLIDTFDGGPSALSSWPKGLSKGIPRA
jgi:hypothetical protein